MRCWGVGFGDGFEGRVLRGYSRRWNLERVGLGEEVGMVEVSSLGFI